MLKKYSQITKDVSVFHNFLIRILNCKAYYFTCEDTIIEEYNLNFLFSLWVSLYLYDKWYIWGASSSRTTNMYISLAGCCVKLFLAFSLYHNVPRLLDSHQPKGSLSNIHGIRFISMAWIILGHTYMLGIVLANTFIYSKYELQWLLLHSYSDRPVSAKYWYLRDHCIQVVILYSNSSWRDSLMRAHSRRQGL